MGNPNCGKCGMLNHAGFCKLTACIYPCQTGMGGYINKPNTNADRIRAMTDEELAEWFLKIQYDISDYYCGGHSCEPILPTVKESWLAWLMLPVDKT